VSVFKNVALARNSVAPWWRS